MPGFTGPGIKFPPQLGPWSKGGGSAPNTPSTSAGSGGGGTPSTDTGGGTPAPAPSFEDLPSTGTGAGISVGGGTDASRGGIWDRIKSWLPQNPISEDGGPFFNPTPSLPSLPGRGGGNGIGKDPTGISMSSPYDGMFD